MSCSLFFSPTKGVTLRQGDTITVTWASGDVPNPPLVSDLNHINLTLENVLQSTNETLIRKFIFSSVSIFVKSLTSFSWLRFQI